MRRASLLTPSRWRWLTSVLLVVSSLALQASTNIQWAARSWQSDEGLPDNSVVGIAQGADGFLWVATRSGLARFDGVRFRESPAVNSAGAPTALLYAMCLDRSNRVWVAKDRGILVCVDRGRTTVLTPKEGMLDLPVRMMVEDREGSLWVSYLEAGGVLRIKDGQVKNFTAQYGLPGGSTCQLMTDKDGQLWFAQGEQVGVYRGGKFVTLQNVRGQRITPSRTGGIWIYSLTPQLLCKYVEGGELVKHGRLPVSRPSVNASVLYEDHTGALWIGTPENGLFRYDGSRFTPVRTSHYEILNITEDGEGNIWAGTRGGGLNRIQPRVLELVDVGSGIASEAVRSVCQDTAGDLWAVTYSGAMVRNRGNGWVLATNNPQYAQCVAADPQGGIWIGTQYKSLHFAKDGNRTNFSVAAGVAAQSVRSVLVTPSGDVWLGTESPNTLQRLRNGNFETFGLPAGSGYVTTMTLANSGELWVGTVDGHLLKFDRDALTEESTKTLSPLESIRSLCATADGSLWIGYGGRGLGRLKNGKFLLLGSEQGLRDDYISHIAADPQGRLWLAGNRGVFYVKQTDVDGLETNRSSRLRCVTFGSEEGLPSLQASYGFCPGAIFDRSGNLLIPTLTGLASVNVPRLKQNTRPPPLVITRVAVDGRLVATYEVGDPTGDHATSPIDLSQPGAALRLPPDQQRVEIEFSALSFNAPGNVSFRYQLEGLDRGWIEIGPKRDVIYTHIMRGDYTFRVQACNELGLWTDPGVTLAIKVLPYYWQTWTFRILAGLLAGALVAGSVASIVRIRHRRRIEQLERQRAMERERTRIAQDLHDDLGSGLTEISFGSEFAQDPTLGLEETRQQTQEIGNRARELVAALDEIVWAVNPKNDTVASLASYLCQYAERFLKPTPVRLRLRVARDLPASPLNAEERHNLFLAVKEALHNVVQHSKAADVLLAIEIQANVLTVIVDDNGCGFDPKVAASEADGLSNMQRRMERIGGEHDLVTTEQGTKATFTLTVGAAARALRH